MPFAWEETGQEFAWESDLPHDAYCDDDTINELHKNITVEEATIELFNFIVELKYAGRLAGSQACILAYWATKAGLRGPLLHLAYPPHAQSGHLARHFDEVMDSKPNEAEEWYRLPTPVYLRAEGARDVKDLETLPPHEVLVQEVWADKAMPQKLEMAKNDGRLPQSYFAHPAVVGETNLPVYPFVLYVDGVSCARHESALGFSLYNFLSGRRHLCIVLRKSELCKCGCRGWCSLWAAFSFLVWSLESLFRGRFPECRHDKSSFREVEDAARIALAGSSMRCKGMLLALKADWGEFSGTLGFPSCSSKAHPCFFCKGSQSDWHRCDCLSPVQPAFPLKEWVDYERACADCELPRVLDARAFSLVKATLDFDRRPNGSRGRALRADLPSLGLLRGDRLEPSEGVPDTGAGFDSLKPPVRAVFWRPSKETVTRHRNPLFAAALGVTPQACIQVDWMHTLSLGIFQDFLASLIQALIAVNAWGVSGGVVVRRQLSVQNLERELVEFYHSPAGVGVTRVQRLDPQMFGDGASPTCKLHAAETNGLLKFSLRLIQHRGVGLSNLSVWKALAADLWRLKELCDLPPQQFVPTNAQVFTLTIFFCFGHTISSPGPTCGILIS